jgi:multisubunit Na+/H+ antiporter MnhE subunit
MARAVELLWWWGAAVGIWLLTLSSVGTAELAVAAACGLPCAVAALAGRAAVRGCWTPRARWAWWLPPLVASIVTDSARALLVAARRTRRIEQRGELREVRLPAGEPDPVAAARRALATLAVTSTPGTLVVDTDPDRCLLVTHSLLPGPSRIEKVVGR